MIPKLIPFREGLRLLGLGRSTFFLNRDRFASAIVKVSPRKIMWREDRLDAWVRRNTEAR